MPRLLADEPALVDAFGSHEKIADALAAILESGNKGLTIGLIGQRGSGKSTVVELLRRRLAKANANPSRVPVFCFDAWAHSGSPLHRAFLEEFCKCLGERVGAELTASVNAVLHRREELMHQSEWSTLTPKGAVLVSLGLLVPAAAAIVASGVGNHPAIWGLGLVAALAPALWIAWNVFYLALQALKVRGGGLFARIKKTEWGLSRLFLAEPAKESIAKTTYTPEPGSVEFASIFGRLVATLENATALIVFDNVDRLNARECSDAWSVMRAYSDVLGATSNHRVWTIVPINAEQYGADASRELQGPEGVRAGQDDALSKILQVKFLVPRPLPSDWKSYARELFRQAELDWAPEEVEVAISCLGAAHRSRADLPTPRAMKLFVNQIVALVLGQPGAVNHGACAALAAACQIDPAWEPRKQLPNEIQAVVACQFKDVAGIYYRTSSDRALQVIFTADISTALDEGNGTKLAGLFEECHELGAALQDVIDAGLNGLAPDAGPRLAHWATALLGLDEKFSERRALLRIVGTAMEERNGWEKLDEASVPGLVSVCGFDPKLAAKLLNSVASSYPEDPVQSPLCIPWVGAFASILQRTDVWYDQSPPLVVGDTPEGYLRLMNAMHPRPTKLPGPACPEATVVAELAKQAQVSQANNLWADRFGACRSASGDWDWKPLIDAAGTALDRDGQDDTAALLQVLFALYRDSPVDVTDALLRPRNSGWLYRRLERGGLAPGLLLAILLTNPTPEAPGVGQAAGQVANVGREQYRRWLGSVESLEKVASLAYQVGAADALLKAIAQPAAAPAILAISKTIALEHSTWPPAEFVYSLRRELRPAWGNELFQAKVSLGANTIASLAAAAPFDLGDADLYTTLAKSGQEQTIKVLLVSGLKSLTAVTWGIILASGGQSLALAVRVAGAYPLGSDPELRDALISLAAGISNDSRAQATAKDVTVLCNTLEASAAAEVRRAALASLFDATSSHKPLLAIFGSVLDEVEIGPADAQRLLESALRQALHRDDAVELAGLESLIRRCAVHATSIPSDIIEAIQADMANSKNCPPELLANLSGFAQEGEAAIP